MPMAPVAIDSWRMSGVAARATIIRATAPRRSDHGARLKNSHQTTRANPPANPPSMPYMAASGATRGTPYRASHCNATMTTPGQSRSGFGGVDVSACVIALVSMFKPFEDRDGDGGMDYGTR